MLNNSEFLENVIKNEKQSNENTQKKLIAAKGTEKIFEGYCEKCTKDGNLIIRYGNTTCTMLREEVSPITQIDGLVHKGTCQNKVGSKIKFIVIDYDKENNTIYISRKSLVSKARKQYETNLKTGDVIKGIITGIDEKIGCFVDIGAEYTAVLPKSELEYVFVDKITDHVNISDEIEVAVKDIKKTDDGAIQEIALSRKAILPKYEELASAYNAGDVVVGVVKSFAEHCIYAQLTKHLTIFCRYNNQIHVEKEQTVRIKIKNISTENSRKMVGDIIGII